MTKQSKAQIKEKVASECYRVFPGVGWFVKPTSVAVDRCTLVADSDVKLLVHWYGGSSFPWSIEMCPGMDDANGMYVTGKTLEEAADELTRALNVMVNGLINSRTEKG